MVATAEAPTSFTTQRKAPGLKVLVPEGQTLPEDLRAALAPQLLEFATDADHAKQLVLPGRDGALIRNAVDSDEVVAIEIARPVTVGPAIPLVPFNREARMTHFVDDLLSTYSDAHQHGGKIRAAIFDGGRIRTTHQEFAADDGSSRVDVHSSTTPDLSSHATHVCGTMGARGVKDQARGMAKRLRVTSFDFSNDLNVLQLVANQYRVSNHSYGPISGWNLHPTFGWEWWGDTSLNEQEDAKFGKYGIDNQQFDNILHQNPDLLAVVAAGNDRNDGPDSQPIMHWAIARNPVTGALGWVQSSVVRQGDGGDRGGLDTIAGLGVSKNCLCIGAIHDITNSSQPILTTEFSSWGCVDDGRVKPDLSANGQDLLSASSTTDSSYRELPGTSMASPTAAGIAAVLMEVFESVHGRFPSSAEIKAILIHTATDDGTHPGPDPVYGWGSINALAAGDLIKAAAGVSIITDDASSGAVKEWKFTPPSGTTKPIRATLVWNDPPAAPNSGGLDDATPVLVHDLDLEIEAPGNSAPLHPYSLNRSDPLSPASTSAPNRVDNVEVIDAPSASGEWVVRVKPHALADGGSQRFTLIVSGLSQVTTNASEADTRRRPE
jgi:subtilisin family serine protease